MKNEIKNYLKKNLGFSISLTEIKTPGSVFLKSEYQCFKGNILLHKCLFISDKNHQKKTPLQILKHLSIVQAKVNDSVVIYVNTTVTHTYRSALIEYKIPFLIPNNQMYIPHLAIELKQHFIQADKASGTLSPAAQSILIFSLVNHLEGITAIEVEESLKYSRMSISRAFRDLDALDIAESKKRKGISFKKCNWEEYSTFMTSPIIKSLYAKPLIKDQTIGLISGETALAEYSSLAAPEIKCVALFNKELIKLLKNKTIQKCEPFENGAVLIESWAYNPRLLSNSDYVDKFSLSLTMADTYDERIQLSLQELMDGANG